MGIDKIDISTLQGKLQQIAKFADQDGNNVLQKGEISVFNQYAGIALSNGDITEDDYTKIFGSEIKSSKVSHVVTNPQVRTLTKKETKNHKKDINDAVSELVNNGAKPDEIKAALEKNFSYSNTGNFDTSYKEMIDEVQHIIDLINATNYNSKEDVENIHKTLKNKLKNEGKWDDFHQDILGILEKQAKNNQIFKESQELIEAYEGLKAQGSQGNNFSAYVEMIKDDLKTKGVNGKKQWGQSYTKEAFKALEQYAQDDARKLTMQRQNDSTATSYKAMKAELKAANTGNDAYQKQALKSSKQDGKILARGNKVLSQFEKFENISKEDFINELGKKRNQPNIFKKVIAHSAASKMFEKMHLEPNPDGKYDLSPIMQIIVDRAGSDFKVNISSDKEMSELHNIKKDLERVTNEEWSMNEVIVLIKTLGYDRQKNNHVPLPISAVAGGIAGVVGAATSSGKLHVKQLVSLTLEDKGLADNLISQLSSQGIQAGVTTMDSGSISIKISQEVLRDTRVKDILRGCGIGLLEGALFDVIFGRSVDETSCISVSDYNASNPTYTDPEQYKEYVAHRYATSPAKVKALQDLVDIYVEQYGDAWHVELHNKIINTAGVGSKLNPEECRTLKYDALSGSTPTNPQTNPPTTPTTPTTPSTNPPAQTCTAVIEDTPDVKIDTLTRKQTKAWSATIETIYPCLKDEYGLKKAIRMLKLAQGVRDGNYSKQRMEALYDATYNKKASELRAMKIEGFDSEYYAQVLNADDVPEKMFVPTKIGNCEKVQGATVGNITISTEGSRGRKAPTTNYTGIDGYTTISFCDSTPERINPSNINSKIDEYKQQHPDLEVTVDDRRRNK